jgi:RimJ/RimL family protein N-acetyltransferase
MTQPPHLTNGVITLRPLVPADEAEAYAAVVESQPNLARWLDWATRDYAREDMRSFIATSRHAWATGTAYPFGIFDNETGQVIGTIALNHIIPANRAANLGYWVRSSRLRKGVASAAVRLMTSFAFEQAGLSRLEIACLPENAASRGVAEKAGAQFECIARNRIVFQGRARDAALYSLIPPGDADVYVAVKA